MAEETIAGLYYRDGRLFGYGEGEAFLDGEEIGEEGAEINDINKWHHIELVVRGRAYPVNVVFHHPGIDEKRDILKIRDNTRKEDNDNNGS